MKTFLPITAAAAVAALALSLPASADTFFQANINAAQAGTNSPGFGVGYFDLLSSGVLNFSLTIQNLYTPGTTLGDPVMMMHFHDQVLPTGVKVMDGPVVHGIFDASVSPLPGSPPGVVPAGPNSPSTVSPLLGATVSPIPASTPAGVPNTEFNGDATKAVTFTGSWSPTDKIEPLTPGLTADLLAGNEYVNIHTAGFMNGAIRGQILSVPASSIPSGTFAAPAVPEAGDFALASLGLLPLALFVARRRRA